MYFKMIHGPYNITTYAVAAKMFNKKKVCLFLVKCEYRVSFKRVKRPGRGGDHSPAFSAEVKERKVNVRVSISEILS